MESKIVDIEAARQYFADAIRDSDFVPYSAEISIRADPALGEAAAIHCRWPLVEKGPYSGSHSREITVQITAGAMNRFRSADSTERGAMSTRFVRIFNTRLLDGQYDEKDPSSPPFIVHVDEHSLES